jgi:hypothetical protein
MRMPKISLNRRTWLVLLMIGPLLALLIPAMAPAKGENDLLAYWAASHLFITGQNPYDLNNLRQVESVTRPERFAQGEFLLVSWNPPWLLLFFAPLSLLPFDVAKLVLVIANVVLVAVCAEWLWRMFVPEPDNSGLTICLFASFMLGATITMLAIGQISIVVLLFVLVGIWALEKKHDWLAGAAFFMVSIKPQVAYMMLLILFLYILRHKRWMVLLGMISVGLGSAIVAWIIVPNWISAYLHLIPNLPYLQMYTSTFGSLMAGLFGIEIFRFSALALLFFVPFLLRTFEREPLSGLSFIFLLSLPFSPYGFAFDQVVLLIAIIQLISWMYTGQLSQRMRWGVAISLVVVYAINFRMIIPPEPSHNWLVLPPLGLLAIYTIAWSKRLDPSHASSL